MKIWSSDSDGPISNVCFTFEDKSLNKPFIQAYEEYCDEIVEKEPIINDFKFDKIINKVEYKDTFFYGIIHGNEKIVFIKAGAGGGCTGYKNKYLKMAKQAHEKLGATVISASNPSENVELDERIIRLVANKLNFNNYELYFVGHSDGAYQNFILASRFNETRKILSINSSYVTVKDLIAKINDLPHIEKIFVCGEKDEDLYPFKNILCASCKNEFRLLLIKNADHQFTNMIEEFIKLINLI